MKKGIFKKLLSLLLCLSMVASWLPAGTVHTSAAVDLITDRVADPNTMNQWQDYFGADKLSTEFAGGVWTDKSVMTDAKAFTAPIAMDDPDRNFLIALSAMAANQKISGYTSAPMDVMLVLDVSGSMDSNGKDAAMIQAANQAIESLLSQNNNNRVGVVLYSGNANTSQNAGTNTATVILPLDRYTTTSTQTIESDSNQITIPAYLTLSDQDDVSAARGVRNSSNAYPNTGSKNVSGGTYIQNGLYKAWGQFSAVTDVVVPAGNAQAGAQRTPVMILMSDGQPTLATDSYNNIQTSESQYGNGNEKSTTWQTVFLTQLTASWVKSMMETKYGTTPKFYTLGLGTGNSDYATAVLNPTDSSTTLDGYWNNFFNNTPNNQGNVLISGNNYNGWRVYKDSNVKVQNYVDQYWLAKDTNELLSAFKGIVETIDLQAADHVTLVEDIGEDMSGYITFTDELGMFMEVKDVKGLVLGETLFTGHELAESLQESEMGTQQNPTDYGNEFISTVRERLGIESVTDAQTLVIAAYADGQLAYDETTGKYSNYIGWYSNDAGDYLGFWDKDTGITAEGAPTGATWINKSYGYLGVAGNSDMMHVIVMISTHIESGMQVVQYKIPASLIPTVTYEIELDGSDPTKMKSITCNKAFPLRLVYEVGLQDDINSVNVEQKLQEAIDAGWGHAHQEENGSYAFYTNLWGAEEGDSAVDYNDPLNHQVAQSHFHPAVGNDRYYYTEDTPVYVKNGDSYELYTGSAAPTGDDYYRAYHYYTKDGYTTEYLPMSEYALQQAADHGQHADGCWYIPEGAIFQQIDRFRMEKSENLTGTLEYFDYPVVVDVGDKYDTYAFLGNNGKITIQPAQGIKLTKTVTEAVEGASDTFTFKITLSQAVSDPDVTDGDGKALTGWSVDGNVITVSLKAGQTVYVTGLPTGVTYTVEEVPNEDYIASSDNASGTVLTNTINAVDFVNVPKGYGNLIISKDVDHPYTNVPEALTNKEFTINVTLSGDDVANKQFAIAGTDPVQYITTDANGSFSVTLKDNGSLTVVGLPEGTTFTTTETLDATEHKGFAMDADRSILSGTIVKDTAVQTHVVNVYAPSSPVATIDVVGTKTLTDEAGTFDWTGKSFTVRLEKYDTATGTYSVIDETTVTEGSLDYKFEDKLTFNAIGTYYYKVSEVIPENRLDGMSYDATVGRFEVQVTDNDVDGQLEFVVYDFDTREQITGSDLNYAYTKNFENIHTTDATYVEFTVDKNVVDPHNTGASEAGYLFELFEVVDGVTSETAAYSMRTVLVDGQGQATFHIPVIKTGTRTFILKEIAPLQADRVPGMTYDSSEYTITVSATAENGKLVPSVTAQKNGAAVDMDALVFENVIDLEPLTLKPYVTKTLNGREPLNDSEFTFNIVQTDGSFATAIEGGYSDTVSVGEGDKYFKEITVTQVGTYYFRTTEVIGNAGGMTYDNSIYHITVNVTAENGALVKDVTYVKVGQGVPSTETDFVQFVNTYVNNDTAEVSFNGTKTLTGRSLVTGEFSFQLKKGETVLQTVANRADGSFVFDAITYTAADVGTHTYTITEIDESKGGVDYDGRTYTVTVVVTDNLDGTLSVSDPVYNDGTANAQQANFLNTYSTEGTKVSFSGTKSWYNTDLEADKAMTGGEFTFVLYASDENYSTQGDEVASTTNSASGSFGFEIDYDTPGHYYYLLREQIEDSDTVSYDTGVYRIHIAVYDNGLGKLVGSVAEIYKVGTGADTIAFENRYTPTSDIGLIGGVKRLIGHDIADGEFQFQLFKADENFEATGDALQTVSNTGDTFTFDTITYDKSGTYYYVVKEVIPEQAVDNVYKGIEYDTTVFGITMNVVDYDGQLIASYDVTVDGVAADLSFINEYNITNYAEVDIDGSKSLLKNDAPIAWEDRVFDFVLLDVNEVQLQKVSVDGSSAYGAFSFQNVPLTEAKTYTFYVQEVDGGLGGITYDGSKYKVTVEVVDDGEGNLVAGTPKYWLNDQEVSQMAFTNTYTLEKTEARFRVSKILENKTLEADMFQFELLDSNGEVLQTKSNLAAGGVLFDAIEYTEPGQHTYTIREVAPEGGFKDGVTYDPHEVTVNVDVVDNGDGTMTANVTYDGLREFTNTYNVSGEPMFSLSGTKELTGIRDIDNNEFTFVLTDAEGNEIETSNTGKTFSFTNVALPGLGTHHFTVTEKDSGKGGVTYDGKEYKVTVTVSDDGKGGMTVGTPVITHNGVSSHLVFTNSYTAKPAEYQLTAQKYYVDSNGKTKTLLGGEFEFTLTGEGVSQTKVNAAGGAITFDKLTFTEPKTYTYTVHEVKDEEKHYITYDGNVYTVTIKVADDKNGQLYVESVEVDKQGSVVFNNIYTLEGATVTIEGTKELVGGGLKAGDFTFDLYETDSSYTVTGQPIASVSNGADGSFSFSGTTVPELAYSEETVRYYVLKENGDTPISEIRYDETVYKFKVTVTDNTEGQLRAALECVNGDKDNILFLNVPHDEIVKKDVSYPESTASIDGKKVYAGETLQYTISYKNYTSEALDVTITDTIPQHTSFVSADNSGSYAGGVVTWNLNVPAGETVTVTFQVKVDEDIQAERIPNKATVVEGNNTYTTNEVINYTVVDEVEKKITYPESTVSINGQKVYAGETLQYAVSYKNTSSEKVTVTITDKIPAHTSFVSAQNGGSYADGTVTWTLDVDAGNTVTVTFQVKVDEDIQAETIPNKATVIEGKNTYETNEVFNYTVVDEVEKKVTYPESTVSIGGKKVYAGETLQYTITYKNTATEKAAVTITDTIPQYTSFVSADNNGTYADGVVTWNLEVPAGQTVTVTLLVKVDENVQAATISNKAQVKEGKNTYTTNEVFNYTVVDEVEKDVFYPNDITTSIDGNKVYAGETLLYTISYKNTFTEDAAVTITDTVPQYTSFVSADNGGTYADGVVTWNLNVPAGETVAVTFQVKVDEDIQAETIPNKATVIEGKNTYTTNEVVNYTVVDEVEKQVTYPESTASIDGKKVYAGETLKYTITYKNTFTEAASVTVTDTIPQYTSFVSADNNGTYADGVVTWNLEVPAGETVAVTFQVKVDEDIQAQTILNKATVVEGKNQYTTNEVFNYTVVDEVEKQVSYPDSTVSINGKKVYAGETLQYTISYKNTFTEAAKVTITDTIPAHTSFVSAENGGTYADGVVTWELDVAAGETVTVTFQVKVDEDIQAERIPNKATVIEGKNTYETNEVFNYTVVDQVEKEVFKADAPTVSIDGKKVNVGDTLIYEISYTNSAPEKAAVTVTDTIPAHTSFVSADHNGSYADGVVTWNLEVPAGQTVTVTLQVKVDQKAENVVIRNQAQVIEGRNVYDTNEVINHTMEDLEKDVFKADAPTVSIDGQKVAKGDILVYTITYRNATGQAVKLELTDAIPAHTSYITGSADKGGTLDKGVLTWNLELEAWESVTVSFKVKVNDLSATITNQATSFDGTNKVQSNTVTNTIPDPIPATGDPTNTDLLMGTMGFSALGILILLAVLVLDRKKGKFEQ